MIDNKINKNVDSFGVMKANTAVEGGVSEQILHAGAIRRVTHRMIKQRSGNHLIKRGWLSFASKQIVRTNIMILYHVLKDRF